MDHVAQDTKGDPAGPCGGDQEAAHLGRDLHGNGRNPRPSRFPPERPRFATVHEAMAWLDRTLPLAARFPPEEIFCEDRLPVPSKAIREVLMNPVVHRDYSEPGRYSAVAAFVERIEVRSVGRLPEGVTAESHSGNHQSLLRSPLFAEVFHRSGAVEIWDRGTNRGVEERQQYGVDPPTLVGPAGSMFVTFKAAIAPSANTGPSLDRDRTRLGPSPEQPHVLEIAVDPKTLYILMEACGRSSRTKFRYRVVRHLLQAGSLEMTLPEKPRSLLQRYRTTAAGKWVISE